ncbi:MAG: porin family protein [Proteobacteria bacterium]|nr:porin family protein [Pseudomonadota bacterium]
MKKRICLVLVAVIFVVWGNSLALGEENDIFVNKFGVAMNISAVCPVDSDADNTVYLGGALTYDFIKYLGVGISSGWARWKEEFDGIEYGYVTGIPVLGDIYLKLPFELTDEFKVVPYGVAGFGMMFWDYEESSLLKDNGISVDVDPSFAMRFGGGVDFFITENFAIFGEVSYLYSDARVKASAFGAQAEATMDTDAWIFGGGVKFVF